MKPDKIVAVLVALFLAALYAWAQTSYVFPISDGQLQTPLDGGGFAITNLGTSTASNAAATYGQVTEGVSGLLSSTNTWTGPNTFNGVLTGTGGPFLIISGTNGAVVGGDKTGNARGANALDIQSVRSAVDQVASGSSAIAIGYNTRVSSGGMLVGSGSTANGIVYGLGVQDSGSHSVIFGRGASTGFTSFYSTLIGHTASSTGTGYNVAVGYQASVGASGVAVGFQSAVAGSAGVAVGRASSASATDSTAVGADAVSSFSRATALGKSASPLTSGGVGFAALTDSVGGVTLTTDKGLAHVVDTTSSSTPLNIPINVATRDGDTGARAFELVVLAVSTEDDAVVPTNMYVIKGYIKTMDGGTYALSSLLLREQIEEREAWDVSLAISGSNLNVVVTGEDAVDVSWTAKFDYLSQNFLRP